MSSLKDKTISGLKTMFLSTTISFVLQFLSTLILARIFVPEDFGIVSAVLIIVGYVDIFWMAGIGPAIVQKKDLTNEDISTGFTTSISLGIIMMIFSISGSKLIANIINIESNVMVGIFSLSFLINSLGYVPLSLVQRNMKFKIIFRKELLSNLIFIISAVIMGIYGLGVWGLVYANLFKYGTSTIVSVLGCKEKIRIGFHLASFKELLFFGGGYSLSRFFSETASQGDYFIITQTMGSYSLGIYNRAYQLVAIPATLLGQAIDQVFFPVMSKLQEDNKALSKMFYLNTLFFSSLFFPMGIALFVLSEEVILVLLGKTWIETAIPLKYLSLFIFFRVGHKISDPVFRAKGKVYNRAFIHFIYAIAIVVFSLLGSKYGLIGVSIGVGIALISNYLIIFLKTYSILLFNIKDYLKLFIYLFILSSINLALLGQIKSMIKNHTNNTYLTVLIVLFATLLMTLFTLAIEYRYIISPKEKELLKGLLIKRKRITVKGS